jgi:hypothetical protein
MEEKARPAGSAPTVPRNVGAAPELSCSRYALLPPMQK